MTMFLQLVAFAAFISVAVAGVIAVIAGCYHLSYIDTFTPRFPGSFIFYFGGSFFGIIMWVGSLIMLARALGA